MTFLNYEFFILLLIIPFYFFKFKASKDMIFLFLCYFFIVIALARPIIYSNHISKDKLDIEFAVAIDFSKSMLADDIKPNRFEFAKEKINTLVSKLNSQKISLLGFSNQAFIVVPSTNDYEVFAFLNKNLSIENINKNGTDYLKILKATNEILSHKTRKFLVLFTDAGEQRDFSKEIEYANQNSMIISIYNIATSKGSPIKHNGELIKDENGKIVVSKLNENIKMLSDKTDGIYAEVSLIKDDMNQILENIQNKAIKDNVLKSNENKNEIFYISLLFAFLFFMLARFDGIKKYMFKKGF